jgi:hypothetical protein
VATHPGRDRAQAVKIRSATTWATIAGIIDRPASTRGVKAVHPARIDHAGSTRDRLDPVPAELAAQIKRRASHRQPRHDGQGRSEVLVKVSGDRAYSSEDNEARRACG